MVLPDWTAWPVVAMAFGYIFACVRYLIRHPHGTRSMVRIFGILAGLYVAHLYMNIALGVIPVGYLGALLSRTGSFIILSIVTWEVLLCNKD